MGTTLGILAVHTALQLFEGLPLQQAVLLPIPRGKKGPCFVGWHNTTVTDMQRPEYLARFVEGCNIGVLLGNASEGLCVIDIDRDDAVLPFLELNPLLKVTLRTHGSRGCSLWMKIKGEYPSPCKLKNARGEDVMEWRANGQQSVIQGIHPNGNAYEIQVNAPPIEIAFSEIQWLENLSNPWDRQSPLIASSPNIDSATIERARKYLAAMPPAISGNNGHDRTFSVACTLVKGFSLSIEASRPLLREYNQRCIPPWSERDLEHKLSDADASPDYQQRGYLLNAPVPFYKQDTTYIKLPGNSVTISKSARQIFSLIAPTHMLFVRGGRVVRLTESEGQASHLEIVTPSAFRSMAEKFGTLLAERAGKDGKLVFKPTNMPEETAKALLDSQEAKEILPSINGLINCPVIQEVSGKIKILTKGYDPISGLLITDGMEPQTPPLEEAVTALKSLLMEFDFATPGDYSRGMATMLTPALRLGAHIAGHIPVDVAEADQSQSGKTYRQRCVAALYNESLSQIATRNGGVGSIDETFGQQLINGNPFIQLDNLRGKLDSSYIESALTGEKGKKTFSVRIPHCQAIQIDPTHFFFFISSNGVQTTRDLANRSSIIRIRKRDGYQYQLYPEGDLLAHIRANQSYYLGCIFAVVMEWIQQGKLRTNEVRHDFKEWTQIMDWIVQNIFRLAPLMDGHADTQERISNPALTLLREAAIAVEQDHRLGEELTATDIVDICAGHGTTIPGAVGHDEKSACKLVGVLLGKVFRTNPKVTLEGFVVTRSERLCRRNDGNGNMPQKVYQFNKTQFETLPLPLSAG